MVSGEFDTTKIERTRLLTFSTAAFLSTLVLGTYILLNAVHWKNFLNRKKQLHSLIDRRTDGIYCSKLR